MTLLPAATTKYRNIKVGDSLVFKCGQDKIAKTVVSAVHFQDLDALYNHFPVTKVLPSLRTAEEAKLLHNAFPGYRDKLKAHGIMAFELL
jgi:ASC-1-like (ASCH) protein